MTIKHLLTMTAVLGLFALAGLAHAGALTDAQIRNFISSMAELQVLSDKYEGEFEDRLQEEDFQDWNTIFSRSLEKVKDHEMYGEIQQIVRANGFSDTDEYGQVGDRIFRAMMAHEMGQQAAQMRADMAQALADIENSPNMNAAQKQQMKEMMRSSMGMMESAGDAPEEDIRALAPHIDELKNVMDYDASDQ